MKKIKKSLTMILSLMLIISVLSAGMGAMAVQSNEAVLEASDGVFRVLAYFSDEAYYDYGYVWDEYAGDYVPFYEYYESPGPISMGTAFLIGTTANQSVLVTNYHVVENSEAVRYYDENGVTMSNVNTYDHFSVAVMGDMDIKAEVKYYSEDYDFAILYLDQIINNKTILSINTETQRSTETCYALGFPGELDMLLNDVDFTTDSVTITQGTISNVTSLSTGTASNIPVYQTTAEISGGNSGGPLVNSNGEVIGVNSYSYTASDNTNYYYAIRIEKICQALDLLGVEYNTSKKKIEEEEEEEEEIVAAAVIATPEPTPEPTEAPVVVEQPSAQEKEPAGLSSNVLLYGIIAGVLIIAIVVVVIVLTAGKKKKNQPVTSNNYINNMTGGYISAAPQNGYNGNQGGYTGDQPTGVLDGGEGATTVLGGGQGGAAVCLIREKTGEKIYINKNIFRLGKDRNRVDYAVTNNTAVSRSHAAIISRNGEYFVIDNNTTNHTYVNETMIAANVETAILSGDKIRLADEEFTFTSV